MTKLLPVDEAFGRLLLKHTAGYQAIADGFLTRPVKVSANRVGWPEDEIEQIVRARIAGFDDDEVRALVIRLHADRRKLAESANQ